MDEFARGDWGDEAEECVIIDSLAQSLSPSA
jgi:hypothetical protein